MLSTSNQIKTIVCYLCLNRGDRDHNKGDSYNRDRNVDRSQRSYNNRDSRDGPREDRRENREDRRDSREGRDTREIRRDPNQGPPKRQPSSEDGEPRMPKVQPDVKPVSSQ